MLTKSQTLWHLSVQILTQLNGYKRTFVEGRFCIEITNNEGEIVKPIDDYIEAIKRLEKATEPTIASLPENSGHTVVWQQFNDNLSVFIKEIESFKVEIQKHENKQTNSFNSVEALNSEIKRFENLAEISRELVRHAELLYKLASSIIDISNSAYADKENGWLNNREVSRLRKTIETSRQVAVEQLKQVRYFHKQATWLIERFPGGILCDVPGLVKLVDKADLKKADWSLTPGRYVGVASTVNEEDFDFEESLRTIHNEIQDLNSESLELAAKIAKNFEDLEI